MIHKTDTINIEGLSTGIYYQVWQPKKAVKAVLLVCHGLGEHGGRYGGDFASFYTKAGIALLAPDLPGHGKTQGTRGHIEDTKFFLDIIDSFIAKIKREYPGKPIFVYGHSMGGLISLWYNAAQPSSINGFIITSPVFGTKDPVPVFKRFMAKLMDKFLPSFCMNNGLNIDLLSKDEKVVSAYKADPLVHDRTSARLGMFILSKGDMVLSQAPKNNIPILMMIGSEEGIVNKEAVDKYCELAPFVDYKVWPDLYHEIHNEPQKDLVFKHTLAWIKKQL